ARLTLVGDGPARGRALARMAAAGVADRVEVTGWVAPERVVELVRAADVCVDPAPPSPLNDRSTMIKIAEYLATGKPVVAYAPPETARTTDGAALLAHPGDPCAMAQLVAGLAADGEARARLG